MPGAPEQPPKVSVPKPEITLNERAQRPFASDKVTRALEGRNNKDIKNVLKEGREVGRGILKLGNRLSSLEGRAPDAWHEVMKRVQSFDTDFMKELSELIKQLKEHPRDEDSDIDKIHFEALVKALEEVRGNADTAFQVRGFYAKNHDRPIKKARYVSLDLKNGWKNIGIKNRFHLLRDGLVVARGHHTYAFENLPERSDEEIAKEVDARKNTPPDHELRDTSLETLKSMQIRLAEFLRVRDYLPEDIHMGELTSVQIIDRMKREYDLVQEAISKLEEFEVLLEGVDTVRDYQHLTKQFPDKAITKMDKKLSKRSWLAHDIEGTEKYELVLNPEKKVSDKEKSKMLGETLEMLVRLDNVAKAYKIVLETLKDKKI